MNDTTGYRASTLAPAPPPPASQVLLFTVYLLQGRSEYGLQRADEFMQAEIDRQVRRYVVLKTAVCVGVGACVGGWLRACWRVVASISGALLQISGVCLVRRIFTWKG